MKHDTRLCEWCNTPYIPKRVDQRTCSKECRVRHNWAESNAKRHVQHAPKQCVICSSLFTPRLVTSQTCSYDCSRQLAKNNAAAKRQASIVYWTRTCEWCETSFTTTVEIARFCCRQHKKNAASARHRSRNPGYYRKYHDSPRYTSWLEANRAKRRTYAREQQRKYRLVHPNHGREWFAANPDKVKLYSQKRRSAKLQSAGSVGISERDWKRLVRRYDFKCAYCGRKPRSVHMDHVIPLKLGGRHAIGNVLPACHQCNSSKNARLLAEWRYDPARRNSNRVACAN